MTVSNDGVSFNGISSRFLYVGTFGVGAVSPSTGPVAGGTMATLTGVFSGAPDSLACKVGTGVTTCKRSVAGDSFVCVMPAMPSGPGNAVVQVSFDGGMTYGTDRVAAFNYYAAPTISDLNPRTPSVNGGVVRVIGAGFQKLATQRCMIGSTVVNAVFVSSSEFRC